MLLDRLDAKPRLTHAMLKTDVYGRMQGLRAVKSFFGAEDFDLFLGLQQQGDYIGEEIKQRVDRRVYDVAQRLISIPGRSGEGVWNQAVQMVDDTIDYSRGILFPDQDNSSSLLTNLAIGVRRPSSVLERLTKPIERFPEKDRPKVGLLKFEQTRQVGLVLPATELIGMDGNGHSREVMEMVNKILEEQFFIDTPGGNPTPYHTFSYHEYPTNRLVGLSHQYPDPAFADNLWVKSLGFQVRTIGLRTGNGYTLPVPALYEPRIKEPESALIKILQRSMKQGGNSDSYTRFIETSKHTRDTLAFLLVVMEGGERVRDMVAAQLAQLLERIGENVTVEPDNHVDPDNGAPDRVNIVRANLKNEEFGRPVEVVVKHLEEHIASQYEVGKFDHEAGVHTGPAHLIYKLDKVVAPVAPILWPPAVHKKNDRLDPDKIVPLIEGALTLASKEHATRLLRSQTIHPDPYAELGL